MVKIEYVQIGDEVTSSGLCSGCDSAVVVCKGRGNSVYVHTNGDGKPVGDSCPCGKHNWILHTDEFSFNVIKKGWSKSTKNMSLISKAQLLFKGEPEKSFIKAGVLDSNEMPTEDGVKLVVATLLKDAEFAGKFKKTVVDPILADEDKK